MQRAPDVFSSDTVVPKKPTVFGIRKQRRSEPTRMLHSTNSLVYHAPSHISHDDPCLFTRKENGELTMIIIWVDDCIIASNRQIAIDELIVALNNKFKICSHPIDTFVGMKMERDRTSRKLYLYQHDYIKKVAEAFHMSSCSPK